MEYRLGNNKKIKEHGQTVLLECPKCKNKVEFSVFTNLDTEIIPKFPLVSNKDVYFLVCPNCAAVFGVENMRGKSFQKGEKLSIGNFDLKELKEF